MFHLKELKNKFKLKVAEYNKIVAFLNNFCGGTGIKVLRPDSPSPSLPVTINIEKEFFDGRYSLRVPKDPGTQKDEPPSGEQGDTALAANDTTEWTAGGSKGLLVYLPCKSESAGNRGRLHWRPFTITADGRIYHMGAENAFTKYYANV